MRRRDTHYAIITRRISYGQKKKNTIKLRLNNNIVIRTARWNPTKTDKPVASRIGRERTRIITIQVRTVVKLRRAPCTRRRRRRLRRVLRLRRLWPVVMLLSSFVCRARHRDRDGMSPATAVGAVTRGRTTERVDRRSRYPPKYK